MKTYIVILSLFITSFVKAQILPLIEKNKVWKICEHFAENPVLDITIWTGEDSLINGNIYTAVNENISGWTTLDSANIGWIREDSADKVYFLGSYVSGDCTQNDSTETLLYDFRLRIGDTIFYPNNAWQIVSGVDSAISKGIMRKKWSFQGYNLCQFANRDVVEGIGSMGGLLLPRWIEFENSYLLGKVLNNTTQIFPDSLDFCVLAAIGINEIESSNIHISPNPFTSQINISTEKSFQYTITEYLGRVVMSGESDKTIETETLSAGCYLLTIKNEETFSVKKMVKQ